MDHPVASAYAKLLWAERHLDRLNEDVADFLDNQSKGMFIEAETDGWYVVRLHVNPVRRRWSLMLGDAIHCLRSGLDHAAWAMVAHDTAIPTSTSKQRRIQFPIFSRRRDFEDAMILEYLSDSTRLIVEQAQPFYRGDRTDYHPLAVVAAFSNEDKHRLPIASLFTVKLGQFDFKLGHNKDIAGIGPVEVTVKHGMALEDEVEICRVQAGVIGPNPDMDVQGRFPGFISFSAEGTPVSLETLSKLAVFVDAIFKRLELSLQGFVAKP